MLRSLMPAFRLVGAQIRTVKYELGKSRPKGSGPLMPEQKFFRGEARKAYDQAAALFLTIEHRQFDDVDLWDDLETVSHGLCRAQADWRKVHPSTDPALELVTIAPQRHLLNDVRERRFSNPAMTPVYA